MRRLDRAGSGFIPLQSMIQPMEIGPISSVLARVCRKARGFLLPSRKNHTLRRARTGGYVSITRKTDTACCFGYLSQRGLGIRGIGRIDQHSNSNRLGHQVVQEPQSLGHKLSEENIDAGHIAARPG